MKPKKIVLVTLADDNHVDPVKQLFASAYFKGGWQYDMLIITPGLTAKNKQYFLNKNIKVKTFKPVPGSDSLFGGHSSTLSIKFYLFSKYFKKWDNVVFLDTDIIVNYSLKKLENVKGLWVARDGVRIKNIFLQKDGFNLSFQFFKNENLLQKFATIFNKKYDLREKSFNTGVIAFSTNIIKTNSFRSLRRLFIECEKHYKNYMGDQHVLNIYFYRKWNELSYLYNHSPGHTRYFYNLDPTKIKIVNTHFLGEFMKPWKTESDYFGLYNKQWKSNLKLFDKVRVGKKPQINIKEIGTVEEFLYGIYLGARYSVNKLIDSAKNIAKPKSAPLGLRFSFWIINLLTIILIFIYKTNKSPKTDKVGVYMLVSNKSFFNVVRTILTLNYFYPGLNYFLIETDEILNYKRSILNNSSLYISFISDHEYFAKVKHLASYELLRRFVFTTGQGKKFAIPLIFDEFNKIILINPGLIFFSRPESLIKWVKTPGAKSLYIPRSTALICIDSTDYKQNNKFENINNTFHNLDKKSILFSNNKDLERHLFNTCLKRSGVRPITRGYLSIGSDTNNINQQSTNNITAVFFENINMLNKFLVKSIFVTLKSVGIRDLFKNVSIFCNNKALDDLT